MNNTLLVRFDIFCRKCKHRRNPEEKDPCDSCLAVPAREGSRKPINFEEKEKMK